VTFVRKIELEMLEFN